MYCVYLSRSVLRVRACVRTCMCVRCASIVGLALLCVLVHSTSYKVRCTCDDDDDDDDVAKKNSQAERAMSLEAARAVPQAPAHALHDYIIYTYSTMYLYIVHSTCTS